MGGEGDRRHHYRVPVAAKRITLHLPEPDGNGRSISARLLDLSPEAMSVLAPRADVSLGTRLDAEMEMSWWGFVHSVTVPGIVRRISDDGTRWAVQFSVEDESTRKRLERFVNRTYKTFNGLLNDGAGARLAESLRRIELGFGPPKAEGPRVILITSPVPAEGKGSVAAGLSMVLGQAGRRVLLVDTDAENPSIAGAVARSNGLHGASGPDDAEEPLEAVSIPIWRNVDLLSTTYSQDASAVGLKRELDCLMRRLRTSVYHYAILNVPPLLSSTSASALATAVDDVFVVARAAVSKERDLIQVRDLLSRDNAPFRGIILTDEPDGWTRAERRSRRLSKLVGRFKKRVAPAVRVPWEESARIQPERASKP